MGEELSRPAYPRVRLHQGQDPVQALGHDHALVVHLVGGLQQVGDHDGHHAGGVGGAHAVVGILQGQAVAGVDPQGPGGGQEGIGLRLAAGVVPPGDDRLEAGLQPAGPQVPVDGLVRRGGGDGPGYPKGLQPVQQFGHPGLEEGLVVDRLVEPPAGVGEQGLHIVVRAEVVQQPLAVLGDRRPDQGVEDADRQGLAAGGGGAQQGVAIDHLAVDQQAVHVEDGGEDAARKDHRRV